MATSKRVSKSAGPAPQKTSTKTSKKTATKTSTKSSEPSASSKPTRATKAALPPASDVAPMSLVGQAAPELDLESDRNGRVKLADLAGKKVVLYFYPKDDTPGCTLEAEDFHAARAAFARKNAVIVGVSRDSVASHARFRGKHGLDIELLSDPDARVLRAYGAWGEKVLYGKRSVGVIRTTFVIDERGVIVAAFPNVKVAGHVDAVLAVL